MNLPDLFSHFRFAKPPNLSASQCFAFCPLHAETKPSLHITVKADRVLLFCHSCNADGQAIAAAVGLQPADLFLDGPARGHGNSGNDDGLAAHRDTSGERRGPRGSAKRTIYEYQRADRTIAYRITRDDYANGEKECRVWHPDGRGGWARGLGDEQPVLYHLPEVLAAVKRGEPVWIVEGEKCAEALRGLGLVATTSPFGAGKWKPEHADVLQGAHVLVLPDHDEPGEAHALDILSSLAGKAATLKRIDLPVLPHKGDVVDWLRAGHTLAELLELAAAAPLWTRTTNGNEAAQLQSEQLAPRPSSKPKAVKQAVSEKRPLFHDPEPWPESVDGRRLVDALTGFFTRYAVLPVGAALVLALWAIATWLSDVFDAFPYLAVTSPQQGCGKSRILELLEYLCRRTLLAANISAAALFRVVQDVRPTLLIDEAQQLRNRDENSAAIHDLLCSGYRRGTYAIRMGGPHNDELRRFSVFCPKAIALIGKTTPILMDRSIEIRMRRRIPKTEKIDRFRFAQAASEAEPLRSQLVRWAADHLSEISEAYLDLQLPEGLEDREAELWSALLAVAGVAIPGRIVEVEKVALSFADAKAAADDSIGVRLLNDLRGILEGHDFLPTREILDALAAIEGAPWSEYRGGKPITAKGLADLLKAYGIEPEKRRHQGQAGIRGYCREAFLDAWERYPSSTQPPNPPQAPQPLQDKGLLTILEAPQAPRVADGKSAGNASRTSLVADVADREVK